jgi:hypothetical protein
MNRHGLRVLLALTALFGAQAFAAPAAHAVGEQVGKIKGRVTDAESTVGLPGVTVTARSPALIGGGRTVMTSDDGRYDLVNLPPGSYTVELSYPGATPVLRQVRVQAGETAPLNVAFTPEATGIENVSVVEQRPITTPDSAQTGATIGADTTRRIPTGRSYQDVAQLVPGVSGGDNPNITGGLEIQNRYLIDGLDITDPVTGTFSANLNFDSIGQVQVLTGGMEAQYNSLGGVINVITKGGSEEFHADASLYANHQKLSAKGAYGANLYDDRQPFNDIETGPNKSYQVNVNVGGPLLHQKLWYNATYELRTGSSSPLPGPPLGAPPYNIQHAAESSVVHLLRLKLTWAPAPAHRVTFTASADPGHFDNVQDSAEKNAFLGVAEQRQNQGGGFMIGTWDWFLGENLNTSLQAGFQVNTIENGPQGRLGDIDTTGCEQFTAMDNCKYDPKRAQHFNLVDSTLWYQGGGYDKDRRWTVQIDPSVSFRKKWYGLHDAKAGFQTRVNYRTEDFEVPGRYTYTDNTDAQLPLDQGLCDPATPMGQLGCFRQTEQPAYSVSETAFSLGFFVQDRWWTPLTWLTVVPGLRFDYGRTNDRNGRTVSSLAGFGPRLALVADITEDGRNVVSVAYGRANEVLSLLPVAYIDSAEAATTIEREWDPTTKGFTRLISKSGGPGGLVIDPNLTTPHTDEVTVSARRQIFTSTKVGLDYTWKRISNVWDAIEINQIWDPSGSRVIDWVDKTKMNQAISLYTTPDANHRTYQGFSLLAEGQPTSNWDFAASYTLSWTYGPGRTEFGQISSISQFDNPRNARYFDGFLPEDTRHLMKGFAAYRIGRFNLGTTFTYQTGTPLTKRFYNTQNGDYTRYRSPFGTEPGMGNDIKEVSEFRLPDYARTDVRLTYEVWHDQRSQRVTLIADVFNVLDARTPVAVTTTDVMRFGGVASRQSPLRVQLAVNYLY